MKAIQYSHLSYVTTMRKLIFLIVAMVAVGEAALITMVVFIRTMDALTVRSARKLVTVNAAMKDGRH